MLTSSLNLLLFLEMGMPTDSHQSLGIYSLGQIDQRILLTPMLTLCHHPLRKMATVRMVQLSHIFSENQSP